jgi:hypothetical protein
MSDRRRGPEAPAPETAVTAGARLSGWRLAFLLVLATAVLIPRLDGLTYIPGQYLWAEDGPIFINQTQAMGVAALWTPYAGYLHTYQRVVAQVADALTLVQRPPVFLVGWLIAYLFMCAALIRRMHALGVGVVPLAVLVSLVSLQPHYRENFFNLTNSQWLLGAGYSILVLTRAATGRPPSLAESGLLIVLGLSGPYCIILVPALLLTAVLRHGFTARAFQANRRLLTIVIACAAVQVGVLATSERATPAGPGSQPSEWAFSFALMAGFGADDPVTVGAAVMFWALLASMFVRGRESRRGRGEREVLPVVFLVVAATIVLAGQYTTRSNLMGIVAHGGGNRYTWIPYVLAFSSATLASARFPAGRAMLFVLAAILCYGNFQKVPGPNLQFASFANFARHASVTIPIEPQWPVYPGWHVEGRPSGERPVYQQAIDLDSFAAHRAGVTMSGDGLQIDAEHPDPALLSSVGLDCRRARDVAVEIDLDRSTGGWMQLFWAGDGAFDESSSLRRWYPGGVVKAQFAFPNQPGGTFIRFDPLETPGRAVLHRVTAYCLP